MIATYLMARASSHYIRNMMSAKAATGRIAKQANAQGEEAVLKKELVSSLLSQVKGGKEIEKHVMNLLDFFQDE
ncbi:hypothetical protein BGZ94_002392 [Podila epigama]|nr:hypothetical protein BGZ94_002392 [Podila epigama]